MDKIVITIARQYGSGGRTIGQMLSEELGIPFYDKDILKITSEESGVNERLFEKMDDNSGKLKTGGFFAKAKGIYDGTVLPPSDRDFTSDDNLFSLQAATIKRLAETESCIIVGRCSNYILKDYPNVLSVFIHAPNDYRMQEASKKLSMNERDLQKFLIEDDRRKEKFSMRYTGREWTDARCYELCLDSGKLGYETCVKQILGYMRTRFPEE